MDEDFLVKIGVMSIEGMGGGGGGKHCFLLVMYGFCSSNSLYSPSLLFTVFIFLLTPTDT